MHAPAVMFAITSSCDVGGGGERQRVLAAAVFFLSHAGLARSEKGVAEMPSQRFAPCGAVIEVGDLATVCQCRVGTIELRNRTSKRGAPHLEGRAREVSELRK